MQNEEKKSSAASLRFRAGYEGTVDITLTVLAGVFGIATSNPAAMGLAAVSAWNAVRKMNRYGAEIDLAVQREHIATSRSPNP